MSASEQIIDNVQVVVKNVHIQYMDKKTDPEVFFVTHPWYMRSTKYSYAVRLSKGVFEKEDLCSWIVVLIEVYDLVWLQVLILCFF